MIDYQKIAESLKYYTTKGYTRVEAPWWVSEDIINITKPIGSVPYSVKENDKQLVGSGEQSFLYMAVKGRLPKGRYVTVTPCFRLEAIGRYSKKCFMKTELIDILDKSDIAIHRVNNMVKEAREFFESYVPDKSKLQIVSTDEGYDIEYDGIELGSYGSRHCEFLDWVYGTGCAEPRFTRAITYVKNNLTSPSVQ